MKYITIVLIMGMILLAGCASEETAPATATQPELVIEDGASATPETIADNYAVLIQNEEFVPNVAEISVGSSVTWTNKDDATHTITFENGDANEELVVGASYTHTFSEAGEYGYFCTIHPGMQGKVIVK